MPDKDFFYIPSLSSRTIVYKGLLLAPQIADFYHELSDPDVMSALVSGAPALLDQHFSHLAAGASVSAISATTARSIRCAAMSTGCMRAQSILASPLFGDDLKKLFPVIPPGGSDSASLRQRGGVADAGRPRLCRT